MSVDFTINELPAVPAGATPEQVRGLVLDAAAEVGKLDAAKLPFGDTLALVLAYGTIRAVTERHRKAQA